MARRRPCFFKILIFDFSIQLRIPYAFVKNLETNLPKKLPQEFVLETSGRRFWHVDVEKADNCLYFRKGWKKFVQQNSLQKGELLVFRYYGNFKFKLEIYGVNCCKKGVVLDAWKKGKQPLSCQYEQKTFKAMAGCRQRVRERETESPLQSDEEKRNKNVQTKILRKLDSVKKRKRNEGSSMLNECANGKASEVVHLESSDEEKRHKNVQTKILRNLNSVKKRRGEGSSMLTECANERASEVVHLEMSDGASDDEANQDSLPDQRDQSTAVVGENQNKSSGLEAAQEFNSNYPFFKVIIRPTYLHNTYNLPQRFVRTNHLKPKRKNIKLQVSNKTWSVKMSNHPYYTRLNSGWGNFVKDNSLQEEDVCLFELIDNDDITFRVTIFGNNS
ncbi:hypothetical protein CRYUN_Cryun29cG0007500 [Craigia yunnanensis]